MTIGIRFIAQCYDTKTGSIIEESLLHEKRVHAALTLKALGYLHAEQIEFLKKIQDFKIKQQMLLFTPITCPNCNDKTKKLGVFHSNFHAVLTDHKVPVQRVQCTCGWVSQTSIDGIYGSSMHPDLLKKQAVQGGKESYEKASTSLDADSAISRPINSHSRVFRAVKCVAEQLEFLRSSEDYGKTAPAAEALILNVDGGHIKARGDDRSFEAMVATVHQSENLKYVDKNHNIITSKTIVASAKNDAQKTMKALLKSACRFQGMTLQTEVTCLADGAENCWTIAHSIQGSCKDITFILDWFHISMKLKNIAIPKEYADLYANVKWHLWHGKVDTALLRLAQVTACMEDSATMKKLNNLAIYLRNNKESIVNYRVRKRDGLVFTSNLAESTVNTLINERQKGKKKMLWSRDGAHNVLQIRSSIASNTWEEDWEKIEHTIYKKAA